MRAGRISDIGPIGSLTKLASLHLAGNQIRDIGPLANLTRLTTLNLSDNQVEDVSPLTKLSEPNRMPRLGAALQPAPDSRPCPRLWAGHFS